ncbi:hypothetical protein J7J18_04615 [bacterium]|nr:hypothetical protein [bacterium]
MKQELKDFIRDWNKTHKTKIRIIGGFAKKGYSKHDIDVVLSKHLPHDIEAQLAQQLSKITGLNRVDIFNPITKSELKILRRGTQSEFGMFGWEALPEQYRPDYLITSYNRKGIPISKGRMSKKDFQQFDYRVRFFAYRDALRHYAYRKIHEKYGYSKLPEKILKLLEKIRREERGDEALLKKYGIDRKRIVKAQREMGLIKGRMYIDTVNLKKDARKRYFKGLQI